MPALLQVPEKGMVCSVWMAASSLVKSTRGCEPASVAACEHSTQV